MRPAATASAKSVRPVTSRSQVCGSVSTTFGGVPRVCRGPATHWTATNGGTRTSTEWPGASWARVRALRRTAAARSPRGGRGAVAGPWIHSCSVTTAWRIWSGSTGLLMP